MILLLARPNPNWRLKRLDFVIIVIVRIRQRIASHSGRVSDRASLGTRS